MKAINFLLLSLIISIAFSCVTPQPKSRANLVAKGRNSNLNGFGEITGRVIDSESKYLLPGASVILLDTKLGAATDRTGTYKISNVPPDTYTMKASFIGFISRCIKHQVQVEENRTIALDFNLAVDPNIDIIIDTII